MASEQNSQRNERLIQRSGIQKRVVLLLPRKKREETRQLNSFLETMQAQIYEAQRALLNKGKEITVRSIRNKMLGIEEEVIDPLKDKSLMPVYREHIKHVSDLVGKEYAKGTLKRFKAAFTSLEAYMEHKCHLNAYNDKYYYQINYFC